MPRTVPRVCVCGVSTPRVPRECSTVRDPTHANARRGAMHCPMLRGTSMPKPRGADDRRMRCPRVPCTQYPMSTPVSTRYISAVPHRPYTGGPHTAVECLPRRTRAGGRARSRSPTTLSPTTESCPCTPDRSPRHGPCCRARRSLRAPSAYAMPQPSCPPLPEWYGRCTRHMRARTHSHTHTPYTHVYVYICIYLYVYIHTHTHTHTHMHIYL
jgi:hypothetical protein